MPSAFLPLMLAVVLATAAPMPIQDVPTSRVDLVQIQLNAPSKVTIGKSFIILDEVENQGTSLAFQTVTGFYLSGDDVLDDSDVAVGARRVPQLGGSQSSDCRTPVTLKAEIKPGEGYLLAVADAKHEIQERSRGNNIRAVRITVLPAETKK